MNIRGYKLDKTIYPFYYSKFSVWYNNFMYWYSKKDFMIRNLYQNIFFHERYRTIYNNETSVFFFITVRILKFWIFWIQWYMEIYTKRKDILLTCLKTKNCYIFVLILFFFDLLWCHSSLLKKLWHKSFTIFYRNNLKIVWFFAIMTIYW